MDIWNCWMYVMPAIWLMTLGVLVAASLLMGDYDA